MRFVGDLSRADARLIEQYAARATLALEFGVGGSTQIIAQALLPGGRIVSVDTSTDWVNVTRQRLTRLGVVDRCTFLGWTDWRKDLHENMFDLVFVDGIDSLRHDFTQSAWELLHPDGVMMFHDTRRPQDQRNVLAIVAARFNEIRSVMLNQEHDGEASNVTVIRKKALEPYVDWNVSEGRAAWQVGHGDPPESFWEGK